MVFDLRSEYISILFFEVSCELLQEYFLPRCLAFILDSGSPTHSIVINVILNFKEKHGFCGVITP
jgi:hypothetical protein